MNITNKNMTALENFLKQIVLKKVQGSVYLLPAICDFQIEEALEEERIQMGTLPINVFTNQREMLITYELDTNKTCTRAMAEAIVDKHLNKL
jgi:virulence-associated protein VapD